MDPMIQEFCRAQELRHDVLRRMQRHFRDVLGPKADRTDALEIENAQLKAEIATLKAGQPEKRKPGRPRKVQPEHVSV